jgi:hypothetical protein
MLRGDYQGGVKIEELRGENNGSEENKRAEALQLPPFLYSSAY